ncbi:MAG: V-type ATP synthase subunit F [Candidatus Micrarchaeaceae archaeon]
MESVKSYKIAVIGSELPVLGFKLAGITEAFEVERGEEAERLLRELLQRQDIGLIAITSGLVRQIKDRKLQNAITNSLLPLIIEIPEYGEKGVESETLKRLIIKAIGIDITKNV